MAKKENRRKAQFRVLNEVKTQLFIQCRNWGWEVGELDFQEMVLLKQREISTNLLSEKANLEYELQQVGSNKKEIVIKVEKLNGYLTKLNSLIKKREDSIEKMLSKKLGFQRVKGAPIKSALV